MSNELTQKQEAVLNFIEEYQLEYGSSPTIREMKEEFNVKSDNSILKHLKALEKKGYIKKDDTPRGIKLLDSVKMKLQANSVSLPLLGYIPAGGPVASEEHVESYMDIGLDAVQSPEKSYLLSVTGDSMINAGIFEGDILIVCYDKKPKEGDIVVGLVDNANTVKRYCLDKNGAPYLKAENPAYEDITPEEELMVQGVVTGLIRRY